MTRYYYSTKSALDWAIAHFWYHKTHYTWLADCFYPHGQKNPRSSNPLRIYEDLYEPWKENDETSKFLGGMRVNLHKGVMSKETERVLSNDQADALRDLCDTASVKWFYPIVFRVDIEKISQRRLQTKSSGQRGSAEYLVTDLAENEFDLLFVDCRADQDLKKVVAGVIQGDAFVDSYEAMDILRR